MKKSGQKTTDKNKPLSNSSIPKKHSYTSKKTINNVNSQSQATQQFKNKNQSQNSRTLTKQLTHQQTLGKGEEAETELKYSQVSKKSNQVKKSQQEQARTKYQSQDLKDPVKENANQTSEIYSNADNQLNNKHDVPNELLEKEMEFEELSVTSAEFYIEGKLTDVSDEEHKEEREKEENKEEDTVKKNISKKKRLSIEETGSDDEYEYVEEEVEEEIEVEEEEDVIEEEIEEGEEEWEGEDEMEELTETKNEDEKTQYVTTESELTVPDIIKQDEAKADQITVTEKEHDVETEEAELKEKEEEEEEEEEYESEVEGEEESKEKIEIDEGEEPDQEVEDEEEEEEKEEEGETMKSSKELKKKKTIKKKIKLIKLVKRKKIKSEVEIGGEITKEQEKMETERKKSTASAAKSESLSEEADLPVKQQEHDKLVEILKGKLNELIAAKKKNKLLTKIIVDYYKSKKMTYVYDDETPTTEAVRKYEKRLLLFEEMKTFTEADLKKRNGEVSAIKAELDMLEEKYSTEFNAFINREIELGKLSIESKTGKPLDESIYQQLVQRHITISNQLRETKLKLIKLQQKITIKKNTLKNLDAISGNLRLIDYEQMRIDNQNFTEKIEERDNELARLRLKVLTAIQTLAHVREKSDEVTTDIGHTQEKLLSLNSRIASERSTVSQLKQKRDSLREETRKLKDEAGLLLRPKLQVDLYNSLKKIEAGKENLKKLTKTFNNQKQIITDLRKHIDEYT